MYVFTLSRFAINQKAILQSIVALPIIEAQYIAMIEVMEKDLRFRGLLSDLGFEQVQIVIVCYIQIVKHFNKNQMFHEKN